MSCDGDGPPTWQVSGAANGFSTDIVFGGERVAIEQLSLSGAVGHFSSPRFGWAVSAGAILDGTVQGRDIAGGGTLGGTVSWLPVYEGSSRPFVSLSASFGASIARATADDGARHTWWAFDLRGGALVGKTLATHFVPYAAARVFGGPVSWTLRGADVTGTDRYHFTVGAGLTMRLPRQIDLSVEVMPVGEQSFTAGVTAHL